MIHRLFSHRFIDRHLLQVPRGHQIFLSSQKKNDYIIFICLSKNIGGNFQNNGLIYSSPIIIQVGKVSLEIINLERTFFFERAGDMVLWNNGEIYCYSNKQKIYDLDILEDMVAVRST